MVVLMIWIKVFLYFLIYCFYFLVLVLAYSKFLLKIYYVAGFKKYIFGAAIYLITVILLLAPIILGPTNNNYIEKLRLDNYFFFYNLICFTLSVLPGLYCFNELYTKKIKRVHKKF